MTDIVNIGLAVDSTSVDHGTESLKKFGNESKSTESATGKLNDSFGSLSSGLLATTAIITGAIAALGGAVAMMRSSIKAADDYNKALTGLASIARYAGENVEGTLKTALDLTKDGILSTADAATSLKNLLAKGFTTDEAVQMISRLKDAAAFGRQSTLGFSEAVVSATEGIKNENSMMIDNAGVTKNAAVMVEEYARAHQKSTTALSESEKRAALFAGLMRETEGQVGNAALATEGLTGKQSALSKAINETAVMFGQALMPALVSIIEFTTEAINYLNPFFKWVIQGFKDLASILNLVIQPIWAVGAALLMVTEIAIGKGEGAWDRYSARVAAATQSMNESMTKLTSTAKETGLVPEIGQDSGARRHDVEIKSAEELKRIKDELIAQRVMEETIAQNNIKNEIDRQNQLIGMDEKSLESKSRLDKRFLELENSLKMESDLKIEAFERDRQMLQENYDAKIIMQDEYNNKMAVLGAAEYKYRAESEQKSNNIILQSRFNVLSQIASLAQMFAGKNKALAIAAIALEKGVAIAQTIISGEAAAQAAGAHAAVMGGLPAYWAAYGQVKTMTGISVGLIAATGIAQAANTLDSGPMGGVGQSSGGNGGNVLSPNVNQVQQDQIPAPRELRVVVESDGPHSQGMRQFARNLAETIQDMGGNVNLVIS